MCASGFKCVQLYSSVFKGVQVCSSVFKGVQVCSSMFKGVQVCCVQVGSSMFKCVQGCASVFKCVQVCASVCKCVQVRGARHPRSGVQTYGLFVLPQVGRRASAQPCRQKPMQHAPLHLSFAKRAPLWISVKRVFTSCNDQVVP